MTLDELRAKVRTLINDHATSNRSIEPLTLHMENVIDGVNKMFYVMNRRVVPGSTVLVDNGVTSPLPYDPAGGFVVIDPAPLIDTRARIQYYWNRIDDAELDVVLTTAIKEANLSDVSGINDRNERVVLAFARAGTYLFMANRAAEYYTLSVGGKTVSKESIFQHYIQMYNTETANAMRLRDDYYQRQGEQYIPSAAVTGSDVVDEDWFPFE